MPRFDRDSRRLLDQIRSALDKIAATNCNYFYSFVQVPTNCPYSYKGGFYQGQGNARNAKSIGIADATVSPDLQNEMINPVEHRVAEAI